MDDSDPFCKNCKRNISAANFASHSAFCERNIKVCQLCNEPVPVAEKKEHLEEYHVSISCDLCGKTLEKWILPKHQEICPKRRVTCEFCEADIPFDEYEEHGNFCGSRTEKCLLCKKYIMLKDKKAHSEMHSFEKNYSRENIQKEVKQNIVNEVISHAATGSKLPEKILESNDGISSSKKRKEKNDIVNKNDQFEDDFPSGATASFPEKQKVSKHFTVCHICKQSIPWIDYNTHLPTCATANGKCSRCGEVVQSHEMKEHMFKNCPMLTKTSQTRESNFPERCNRYTAGYNSRNDLPEEDQSMKLCPFCKQPCSADRILEHIKFCSENYFICPLCSEKVCERDRHKHETSECRTLHPRTTTVFHECSLCGEQLLEEDKAQHESFLCPVLLQINQPQSLYPTFHDSTSKNLYIKESENYMEKCPLCNEEIPQTAVLGHERVCKMRFENSCVYCKDPVMFEDKERHLKQCKMSTSQKSYGDAVRTPSSQEKPRQKNTNDHCKHCDQVYYGSEDVHFRNCHVLKNCKQSRATKNEYDYKGAVPKHSDISDMIKPKTKKCKYCGTTLNYDILIYHENECVHQPIKCEDCGVTVLLADYGNHKCKLAKGKDKHRKREGQTYETRNSSHSWFGNFFGNRSNKPNAKTHDQYENDKNQAYENGRNQAFENYSTRETTSDTPLYFSQPFIDDTKIPCEFCDELIPASEFILHETGCNPREVSFAKQNTSDNAKEKAASPRQNSKTSDSSAFADNFFSTENRFLPCTKFESIQKKNPECGTRPGEFLSAYTAKISSKSEIQHNKYQSVWNNDSPDVEMEDIEPKMHDNVNEREKEKSNKSETDSTESDEELSNMLAFIKDDKSCNVKNEKKIVPDNSKYVETTSDMQAEQDLNLQQHNHKDYFMSSKQDTELKTDQYKYFSESVHISNTDSVQDKIVNHQLMANFRFGGHKMTNLTHGTEACSSCPTEQNKTPTLKLDSDSSVISDDKETFEPIYKVSQSGAVQDDLRKLKLPNPRYCDKLRNACGIEQKHLNQAEDDADEHPKKNALDLDVSTSNKTTGENKEVKYEKAFEYILNTNEENVNQDKVAKQTLCNSRINSDIKNLYNEDYGDQTNVIDSPFYKKCALRLNPGKSEATRMLENSASKMSLYDQALKSISHENFAKREMNELSSRLTSKNNEMNVSSDNREKLDCREASVNKCSEKKAFSIEPAKDCWNPSRINDRKASDNVNENSEHGKSKNLISPKSHFDTTQEDDDGKWAKWSSDSS